MSDIPSELSEVVAKANIKNYEVKYWFCNGFHNMDFKLRRGRGPYHNITFFGFHCVSKLSKLIEDANAKLDSI